MGRTALTRVLAVTSALLMAILVSQCGQIPTGQVKPDGGPTITTVDGGTLDPAVEAAALHQLATAFNDFHNDTDGWPFGHWAWLGSDSQHFSTLMPGLQFNSMDTAMFTIWPKISKCDATHTGGSASPCWNGPYEALTQDSTSSLGTPPWLDIWGRPRMYSYVRPMDGNGGGFTNAAGGLIYIWSRGPDGIDGFTCSDGNQTLCPMGYDINQIAMGSCSQPSGCDDIIVAVSASAN